MPRTHPINSTRSIHPNALRIHELVNCLDEAFRAHDNPKTHAVEVQLCRHLDACPEAKDAALAREYLEALRLLS